MHSLFCVYLRLAPTPGSVYYDYMAKSPPDHILNKLYHHSKDLIDDFPSGFNAGMDRILTNSNEAFLNTYEYLQNSKEYHCKVTMPIYILAKTICILPAGCGSLEIWLCHSICIHHVKRLSHILSYCTLLATA